MIFGDPYSSPCGRGTSQSPLLGGERSVSKANRVRVRDRVRAHGTSLVFGAPSLSKGVFMVPFFTNFESDCAPVFGDPTFSKPTRSEIRACTERSECDPRFKIGTVFGDPYFFNLQKGSWPILHARVNQS